MMASRRNHEESVISTFLEDPKLYKDKIAEFQKAEENQLRDQMNKIEGRFKNAY